VTSVYTNNRDGDKESLVDSHLYRVVAGFSSLTVIVTGVVMFSVRHVKSSYVYRSNFSPLFYIYLYRISCVLACLLTPDDVALACTRKLLSVLVSLRDHPDKFNQQVM
jgi:cytochrome b subunit of formate dehydrogenase